MSKTKTKQIEIMNQTKERKMLWFASGGDIARCGPFETQVDAYKAMILHPSRRSSSLIYPTNIIVWPEWVDEQNKA